MTNLQAIDLLKGLEQSLDDYCELNDEGKTAFGMAIAALELFGNAEQLPSAQTDLSSYSDKLWRAAYERGKAEAQPQRMRGYERVVYCGECAHMMPDGRCREFADDNIRPSASDYCSAGEKRADMKEEQDETD